MQPDRLTDAQEAHVRRILQEEMANHLTPARMGEMLRQLLGTLDDRVSPYGLVRCFVAMFECAANERSDLFKPISYRHLAGQPVDEAARREAEAKPVKISQPECHEPGGCIAPVACVQFGKCPQKPEAAPQGEREGPGSAAAPPCTPHSAYCVTCGLGPCRKDKPTPAADELVARLRTNADLPPAKVSYVVMHEAADRIEKAEARVRELEADNAAVVTFSKHSRERAYAESARVRELEKKVDEVRQVRDRNIERAESAIRDWHAEKARADRLAAAVAPFARAADIKLCGEWRDDQTFGQTDVAFYLTFGDLRRAKSALSTEGGDRG